MQKNQIKLEVGASVGSSVKSSFQALDSRISSLSEKISGLRAVQGSASQFSALSRNVKESNLVIEYHKKTLERLNKEISAKGKVTTRDISFQEKANLQIAKATLSYDEQREKLGRLSRELQAAGVDTDNLASAQARLATKVKQSSEELSSVRNSKNQKITEQMVGRERDANIRGKASSLVGSLVAVGAALVNPVLFEREMTRTSMIAKGNLKDEEAKKNFNPSDLQNAILDIGKEYSFSSLATAKTAGDYAQSGFSPDEIKGVLAPTFDIATISRETPESVAELMQAVKSSFQLKASSKKDMGYLANVIMKTANSSDASVASLIESSKYLGGLPREAGLSLSEAFGMLSTVSPVLKGSEAGTSIVQFLEKLSRKTTREKLSGEMGIDVMRNGKMRHVFSILEDLKTRTRGMDKGKKLELLTEIFDTQASRALLPILQDLDRLKKDTSGLGRDFFESYKKENKKDYTTVLRETADNNTYGSVMKIVSALDVLSIKLFSFLQGDIRMFSEGIVSVFGGMTDWISRNEALAKTITRVSAVVVGATISFKLLRLGLLLVGAVPLAPWIAGIGLVGTLVTVAYHKFESFRNVVDATGKKIREFFNFLSGASLSKHFSNFVGGVEKKLGISLGLEDFGKSTLTKEGSKILDDKRFATKRSVEMRNSTQLNATINISTSHEQNSEDLAEKIKGALSKFLDEKNQSFMSDSLLDPVGAY